MWSTTSKGNRNYRRFVKMVLGLRVLPVRGCSLEAEDPERFVWLLHQSSHLDEEVKH